VTAELTKTVGELKSQLEADVGVPPEQMRLIYAGRVLKDQQTLASYNIEDGHTVHLVQGAAAPAASITSPAQSGSSTASPGGGLAALAGSMAGGGGSVNPQMAMMQDPEMMREMMNSPMMQSLMSNPELMRTIIQSNPQMQAIIEQNPEIGHVLNNPAVLRQTLEVARSPELMREMMRTTDRAMSNIESHPEGFNMLRRMYHNVQEPLMDAASGARNTSEALQETPAPACDPNNPFAELFVVRAPMPKLP
jgi:ubiquilin